MNFAGKLKEARKLRKWTQQNLADRSGITRNSIGAYEEGRAVPPLSVFIKLCRALNVKDINAFLEYGKIGKEDPGSDIENSYYKLTHKEKRAVDILLGID